MPYYKFNWLAELMVVIIYFPLLIALGAGATLRQGLKNLCVFSGKISYPLYMTHYTVIWMFGNYYSSRKAGTTQLFFIVPIAVILLVGFAYIAMTRYDIPIRSYLTGKRKQIRRS